MHVLVIHYIQMKMQIFQNYVTYLVQIVQYPVLSAMEINDGVLWNPGGLVRGLGQWSVPKIPPPNIRPSDVNSNKT